MYELFGAAEVGKSGVAEFKLFFPDSSLDPLQYTGGGQPHIKRIRAVGTFQAKPWDPPTGIELQPKPFQGRGHLYTAQTPKLKPGFYEYKYFAEFENDPTPRWVGDPCTKYGGKHDQNAGFVVDMRDDLAVIPIQGGRPAVKDLVIYEIMLDDFVHEFLNDRAPLDALMDKIPHFTKLGINAVELMPWTAWPNDDFNWGYEPYAYFSVAHRYTLDPTDPTNKLVYLKKFINECHKNNIAVIMDGVFNHVQKDPGTLGFAYYHLYEEPADCPYVGNFMAHDFDTDLDYANGCTNEFITDVLKYWISIFKVDGFRLDNTLGFYSPDVRGVGLPKLLVEIRNFFADPKRPADVEPANFNTTLEHSWDYAAIDVVNKVGASSCWYDPCRSSARYMLTNRQIDRSIMRMLNASRDFGPGHLGTAYIENHDHSTFMVHAGPRSEWWRTQPWMIALFTMPAALLLHNGQEWGQQENFPEMGETSPIPRVTSRPLHWDLLNDDIGKALFQKYQSLIQLRRNHPGLRSSDFYPADWQSGTFDGDGFGVDEGRQLVVYRRSGPDGSGKTELFMIALNFSRQDQGLTLTFPANGRWKDLLSSDEIDVTNQRFGISVPSNWGRVWFLKQ